MMIALRFANSVFILAGAFFVVLLAHYIIDYEKHWYGIGNILVYYAMPGIVAGLLFAGLWLKEGIRINIALVIVFCAVPIYSLESVLAVAHTFAPAGMDPILPDADSPTQKSALTEFKDMRSKGIDIIPRMSPYQWPVLQLDGTRRSRIIVDGREFWPLGSISRKTVMMCRNMREEHYITHESDEHGFNNPKGIWEKRPIHVLALGDSHTYGECVSPEKGYVSVIRRELSRTINLGMRGNGPLLMLASLMEYGLPTRAKYVLWFFNESGDLSELMNERTMPFLMQYLSGNQRQGLIDRQREIDRLLDEAAKEKIRKWEAVEAGEIGPQLDRSTLMGLGLQIAKLWNVRNRLGLAVRSYPGELRDENFDVLEQVIKKGREETASWGGTFILVYMPSPQRYIGKLGWTPYYTRVYEQVMARMIRSGVPMVDLHSVLEQAPPTSQYFHDLPKSYPSMLGNGRTEILPIGHFNELGHATAARAVIEVLSKMEKR